MPEFLSDEWLHALDEALRSSPPVADLAPLAVEQVVDGVPGGGNVRYQLRIDAGGARIVAPPPGPADVRMTTDYATAVAIARGELNAQIALAEGRLRIGGNVDALARHATALAALDDATTELRSVTIFRAL